MTTRKRGKALVGSHGLTDHGSGLGKGELKHSQAATELNVAAGRYSNHIQCTIMPEEFVLDFFVRVGENAVLTSRILISPAHAERLYKLLKKQLELRSRQRRASPKTRRLGARR